MWGAIIGDMAGSIYEFDQVKEVKKVVIEEIIPSNAFYSDDTILTIAILDAIFNSKNYERCLKAYGNRYIGYLPDFSPYFKGIFSPAFTKWITSNEKGVSCGNGAIMRISPVGFMFKTEEEVIDNAMLATIPSHKSNEAINYAIKTALIIFYARNNISKDEILRKMNIKPKYTPFTKFNLTCKETFDNCLYAAFTSNSFEEAITKVISYGGDTDTNACITGSIAEALYGIDESLIILARNKLPKEFLDILDVAYTKL